MARSRNLKPSIFKNEILGTADPLYTILFECLWCLSDREGRLEDRPMRIKVEAFPYRDGINIESMLNWLENNKFIVRYSHAEEKFIQIINFKKHQNPHVKETASSIPAPVLTGSSTGNSGTSHADSLNPITDSPIVELKLDALNKKQKFTLEDLTLAKIILADIRLINPNHREPNLGKWADTIRLMNFRDGRTHSEILDLWQWANKHQFWSSNILSPDKLRDQWDRLVIQKKQGGNNAKPSKLQQAANALRAADERAGRHYSEATIQDVSPEPGLRAITRRSANGDSGHD